VFIDDFIPHPSSISGQRSISGLIPGRLSGHVVGKSSPTLGTNGEMMGISGTSSIRLGILISGIIHLSLVESEMPKSVMIKPSS
jgi:hypothetical protein